MLTNVEKETFVIKGSNIGHSLVCIVEHLSLDLVDCGSRERSLEFLLHELLLLVESKIPSFRVFHELPEEVDVASIHLSKDYFLLVLANSYRFCVPRSSCRLVLVQRSEVFVGILLLEGELVGLNELLGQLDVIDPLSQTLQVVVC